MNTQENASNSSEINQYTEEDPKVVELREAIYQALGDQSGVDIDIEEGGAVWLSGTVDDQRSKDWVAETVRDVSGVKELVNNLTIKVIV